MCPRRHIYIITHIFLCQWLSEKIFSFFCPLYKKTNPQSKATPIAFKPRHYGNIVILPTKSCFPSISCRTRFVLPEHLPPHHSTEQELLSVTVKSFFLCRYNHCRPWKNTERMFLYFEDVWSAYDCFLTVSRHSFLILYLVSRNVVSGKAILGKNTKK